MEPTGAAVSADTASKMTDGGTSVSFTCAAPAGTVGESAVMATFPTGGAANVTTSLGRTAGSAASRVSYRAQYALFVPPGQTGQFGVQSSIESLPSPARSLATR